nr:hypothetical protein [Akkermansiaceae bacterium]
LSKESFQGAKKRLTPGRAFGSRLIVPHPYHPAPQSGNIILTKSLETSTDQPHKMELIISLESY